MAVSLPIQKAWPLALMDWRWIGEAERAAMAPKRRGVSLVRGMIGVVRAKGRRVRRSEVEDSILMWRDVNWLIGNVELDCCCCYCLGGWWIGLLMMMMRETLGESRWSLYPLCQFVLQPEPCHGRLGKVQRGWKVAVASHEDLVFLGGSLPHTVASCATERIVQRSEAPVAFDLCGWEVRDKVVNHG